MLLTFQNKKFANQHIFEILQCPVNIIVLLT